MSELNYNHREFLALTGLALAVPAISAISAAETPAPARCLVYDDQGASRCRRRGSSAFTCATSLCALARRRSTRRRAKCGSRRPPIRPSESGCLYQYPVSAKCSSTRMTAERGTLADP
jgi:hypothetical protein